MKFCKPNLPTDNVNTVIVSGEYSYIIRELRNLGVNSITTSPNNLLPIPERYHADMQCSYYCAGKIAISSYSCNSIFVKNLTKIGLKITKLEVNLNNKYPNNVWFNHLVLNNKIICNKKYTPSQILEYCSDNSKKIINVNQGYTKCSTAVVSDNAIITSDTGIATACKKYGLDVLKIRCGYILLPYYNYGFIGGCCGKLSDCTLAFTGKIKQHPDYNNIKSFLLNHQINILELSNKPLLDIGSILPLIEN